VFIEPLPGNALTCHNIIAKDFIIIVVVIIIVIIIIIKD
jgi:hypothetical protein